MRFEVDIHPGVGDAPVDGRLLVVIAPEATREPWRWLGPRGPVVVGRDVVGMRPGVVAALDENAARSTVGPIPEGVYACQAILTRHPDDRSPDAPGNLVGPTVSAVLPGVVGLALDRRFPPRSIPADTGRIKYITIRSALLSNFHGRPIDRHVGVVLPEGHDPRRRYPLRVHIGGLGERAWSVHERMDDGRFRRALDDSPPTIYVHLDGGGPLGDPAQVDSAGNGPVGRSVVEELIPRVEREFSGLGTGQSRALEGESTGGWAALSLQIAYPDQFNGAWASSPDPVDFRAFQTVDIYRDANMYTDEQGRERPAARDRRGQVAYTVRDECVYERALGAGDRIAASGGQWGSWSAAFGPLGDDRRPARLWDATTGAIDPGVAEHWARHDLRRSLQRDWAALGPRLAGKLHVSVGDADEFALDGAVLRLGAFLAEADPPAGGWVRVGRGRGHCWSPLDGPALARAIADRIGPAK